MTSTHDTRSLGSYPTARGCPFSPPTVFAELRDEDALPTVDALRGRQPRLITRYEDAKTVLASPNFSARMDRPGYPLMTATDVQQLESGRTNLIRTDDPEHLEKRRRLTRDFTVKRINTLEPDIQRIIDESIDELLATGAPADLVSTIALPIPSRVICLLLGVPYQDHAFFQRSSAAALSGQSDVHTVDAALRDLSDYLNELVDAKLNEPGDDVLSRLAHEFLAPGVLDRDELITTAMTLLVAGFETTGNMISLGTAALLHHPEQLRTFLAGDRALQENAVEELLRYLTIAQHPRQFVALADTQVGDNTIQEGEGVLIALPSANRDTTAFTDPDTLDITRAARSHVAFSYGPHQCLGQSLARRELLLVYRTLFTRIPTLALADAVEDYDLKTQSRAYGFNSLTVTWQEATTS